MERFRVRGSEYTVKVYNYAITTFDFEGEWKVQTSKTSKCVFAEYTAFMNVELYNEMIKATVALQNSPWCAYGRLERPSIVVRKRIDVNLAGCRKQETIDRKYENAETAMAGWIAMHGEIQVAKQFDQFINGTYRSIEENNQRYDDAYVKFLTHGVAYENQIDSAAGNEDLLNQIEVLKNLIAEKKKQIQENRIAYMLKDLEESDWTLNDANDAEKERLDDSIIERVKESYENKKAFVERRMVLRT